MSASTVLAGSKPPSAPRPCGGMVVRKSRPGMRPMSVSRDAQRVAAAILEVLAGVRTPTEAAAAVGLSVPRYYLWEQRALEGLVRACEPRPVGKVAGERHQMVMLEKEVARLRQDCARQQALVRAAQRTIGLGGAPPSAAKPAGKPGVGSGAPVCGSRSAASKAGDGVARKAKRKRRPVARALKAVAALQTSPGESGSLADSSSAIAADMVQRSISSSSSATVEAASAVPPQA